MDTFDLDTELSGVAQFVGAVPWVSEISHPVAQVAAWNGKDGKYPGHLVIISPNHGLNGGDKVFIGGFGPTLDNFHIVVEHPSEENRSDAFLIDLPGFQFPEDRAFLTDGILRQPKTYHVLHRMHVDVSAGIELRKLEAQSLEVLKIASPDAYRKTMTWLAAQLTGVPSYVTFQSELDILTNLGKADVRNGLVSGKELDTHVLNATNAIKNLADQYELLLEARSELSDAEKAASGEADTSDIRAEVKSAEGDLLALEKITRETIAELERLLQKEEDVETLNAGAIAKLQEENLYIKCREIEILCGMQNGLMLAMAQVRGIEDLIAKIHDFIAKCIAKEDLRKVQSSSSPKDNTKDNGKGDGGPKKGKQLKSAGEGTTTILKAS